MRTLYLLLAIALLAGCATTGTNLESGDIRMEPLEWQRYCNKYPAREECRP